MWFFGRHSLLQIKKKRFNVHYHSDIYLLGFIYLFIYFFVIFVIHGLFKFSQEEYGLFAAKKEAKKAIRMTREAEEYVKADVINAKTEVTNILELAAKFASENKGNAIFKAAAIVEAARSIEEEIVILADEVAEEVTKIEAAAEAAEKATTGAIAKAAARITTIGAEATRDAARKSAAAVQKLKGSDMKIYDDDYGFNDGDRFEYPFNTSDYFFDDDYYYYYDEDDNDDEEEEERGEITQ